MSAYLDVPHYPASTPSIKPRAWGEFAEEVLGCYEPPMRARATYLAMRHLLAELGRLGVRSTADLTIPLVTRWIRAQVERGRHPNTIRGHLSRARTLCAFACACGYLERTPFAARREWIRGDEPAKVRHLPMGSIAALLGHLATRSAESWELHRLYALTAVIAYTGVRTSEALHLKVEDVLLPERYLIVGARRRLKTRWAAAPVPIPEPLADILGPWIGAAGSDWLIPAAGRDRPWVHGMFGSRPVNRLRDEAIRAGIGPVTFLMLRHSWATHAESAWRLTRPEIQRVLRHTTMRTQDHYCHADIANLRRIGGYVRFGEAAVA